MSTNLIINQNTNIKKDRCNSNNKCNNQIFDYQFLPSIKSSYIDSTNIVGVIQDNNFDLNGNYIDNNTELRNGALRDEKSRRELETRIFPGAPFLSSGQSILKNPDLSSRLKYGEDTRTKKSANAISSYSADNFIPLVPSIAENIQNVDHIIPTFWVRGGMSSRSVLRNIDYLKSCGLKR
jgi:hypothetical protein